MLTSLQDTARALQFMRYHYRSLNIDPQRVVLTDWADNRFAYIDQDLDFADRIGRVRKWFDESGYVTFGRFGRYEYHHSDQCIARAMEVHGHVREIAETGRPARPRFG